MEALAEVARWPADHATAGVVRAGSGRPEVVATTGPVDRPFAWASVTKLATALAVLVAVEEGTLSLDEPAGPPGSTVRHLLAHASGLGPGPGPGNGPPLLAPGVRRIYSSAGYLVLADLVGERSGLSFATYLSDGVLVPLDMARTTLSPDPADGGAAAGLSGPLVDLLALAAELAAPTLVSADTARAATTVQFPGLAGVLPGFQRFDPCDWGLGPELADHKRPHWTGPANSPSTFGHFGQSGSFLWVDPAAGLACASLSDRPFGRWAVRAWPALADAVVAELGPV